MKSKTLNFSLFTFAFLFFSFSPCPAVNSKVTRQNTIADFQKGKPEDVVIGSQGTLQLGRASEVPAEKIEDVWSINCIVVNDGSVFLGTSPNGEVYKYSMGKLTRIYPLESEKKQKVKKDSNEPNDANKPARTMTDSNAVKTEQYLANKHIFAMSTDISGRLLVGISGDNASLCRLDKGMMETIFEPNGVKYILDIAVGTNGNIYLGTGPKGMVYQLDSFGKNPQVIYDSPDKNILSLAIGKDGLIYAGSDGRGLVYKIDTQTKTAAVLYDSEQPEITALLFADNNNLYVAATSANIIQPQREFAPETPSLGRPEPPGEPEDFEGTADEGDVKLKTANTKKTPEAKAPQRPAPVGKGLRPEQASYIYKINKDGFVTDIFSKSAVFLCLAQQDKKLLVGTGNNAQLYAVDPASEQQAMLYEDQHASQITAMAVSGDDLYLATANPPRLIKLAKTFALKGTYTSDLIDAGQPAKWGMFQIEADIPKNCKVLMACRSGNVKDINDPTFSKWSEPAEVTRPVQLLCPTGRFCQYKLLLQSYEGKTSPLIREVTVADVVANLAPTVESINVTRMDTPEKKGVFKISYDGRDGNNDKLIYKIDFRKIGRTGWIELAGDVEADNFEWDGKTAEDGRYEIRVTASDERNNTPATKLSGSRISDPVIVDNTGPVIKNVVCKQDNKNVTITFKACDELSAISQTYYAVDSNSRWIAAIPDDMVFDTLEEDFTLAIEDLAAGDHVVAIKALDAVGNTTYKTIDVKIDSK